MFPPWTQVAFLIGLTHAFRGIGKFLGPRRSGLLLGLPSTTALLLLWTGFERGTAAAAETAEACLLGLVAAALVPLIYLMGVCARLRVPWIPAIAIAGYALVMTTVQLLPELGTLGRVFLTILGLVSLCHLSARLSLMPLVHVDNPQPRPVSPYWVWTFRTILPIAYVVGVRSLREWGGNGASAYFITFPGATLAILITTHLEAGPAAASRLALALPFGSLGMFSFLTAFRVASPSLGLEGALLFAVLLALLCLVTLEVWQTTNRASATRRLNRYLAHFCWSRWIIHRSQEHSPFYGWTEPTWTVLSPRRQATFAPRIERLCG